MPCLRLKIDTPPLPQRHDMPRHAALRGDAYCGNARRTRRKMRFEMPCVLRAARWFDALLMPPARRRARDDKRADARTSAH